MSILSANTLFHFTPREYLLDKFENGFAPRYNKEFDPELDGSFMEKAGGVISTDPETGERTEKRAPEHPTYIPLVSFCDIPLSSLIFHMDVYSRYGLGLKKSWGEKQGLNPVMYINRESIYFHVLSNSILANDLFYLMYLDQINEEIKSIREKGNNIDSIVHMLQTSRTQLVSMRNQIIAHMKPRVCRGKYRNKFENYLYYDEKEWRYVPFLEPGEPPAFIDGPPKYNLEKLNKQLREKAILFSAQDIKYIIVDSDADVEFVVKGLNDIKRRTRKYTEEDIHHLTTKIITRTQIKEDF